MKGESEFMNATQVFFLLFCFLQGGYMLLLPYQIASLGLWGMIGILLNACLAATVICLGKWNRNKVWQWGYRVILGGNLIFGLCCWQEMLNSEFLIDTPRIVAVGAFMLGLAYFVGAKPKALAQFAQLTIPILFGIWILVMTGNVENMSGLHVGVTSLPALSLFLNVSLLGWPLFCGAWLWPYLQQYSCCGRKVPLVALGVSTILIVVEHLVGAGIGEWCTGSKSNWRAMVAEAISIGTFVCFVVLAQ